MLTGAFCDHGRSRTLNLLSRNQVLYPIELRGQNGQQISDYYIFYANKCDL